MTAIHANKSTLIFLVNADVRLVKAIYEEDGPPGSGKVAPRAYYKTFDPAVVAGDLCLVVFPGARHGLSVVKVTDVDVPFDIDLKDQVHWLGLRIDKGVLDDDIEDEKRIFETVASAEKRKRQDELRAAIFKDNPELAKLEIVNRPAPSIEAKPTE